MAQVIAKTNDNIYWLRFPKPGQNLFSSSIFNLEGKKVIDIRWLNNVFYNGWKEEINNNEHHILSECYYYMILPFISLYIKSFPFNINDFELVKCYTEEKKYNVSYLVPKNKDLRFSVEVNGEVKTEDGDFNCLHCMNGGNSFEGSSEYHNLFVGTHQCSIIKNKTINNDKTIFITGDSMMVPAIPIFACYYKEVVFMDNRSDKSFKHYYEGKVFDEVIVQLWEGHTIDKPLGENLR